MTRFKAFILVCFCLAFLAGVSTGVLWNRMAKKPRGPSWIERELDLTPEQREQMREIWFSAMGRGRQQQREQRRIIREERDKAIQGLFNEEQTAQYEEIVRLHEEKSAALDAARDALFKQAVEQTKAILTESQRAKYEELLKQGPPGGHRRPGPHNRGPGRTDQPPPPNNE